MLVLKRKISEQVIMTFKCKCGCSTVASVEPVQFEGHQTKLGFTAGSEVTINRKEVQDQLDAGNFREGKF